MSNNCQNRATEASILSRERLMIKKIPEEIIKFVLAKFEIKIVAFSGGTDSTLLLLFLKDKELMDQIDYIVFNNTRMVDIKVLQYIEKIIEKLGLKEKFVVVLPKLSRKELLKMIDEDFEKYKKVKYSKHHYRCCVAAKEKPFVDWLKSKGFDNEQTIILRGLRANESSQRFMSVLKMIRTGQLYYNRPRYCRKVFVSNPLQFLDDETKKSWLIDLCLKFNLNYPNRSGCTLCPIREKYNKNKQKNVLDNYLIGD